MRTRFRVLALVLASLLELGAAAPAQAQMVGYQEADMIDDYSTRCKKRYQKRVISGTIFGGVGFILVAFIALNMADKKAARRALMQRQQDRQDRGLM